MLSRPSSYRPWRLASTISSSSLSILLLSASPSWAAQWQTNVNYGGGANPSMNLYVPDNVDDIPGIVVALHYCTGTAQNTHGWFQTLADQHGFLIISPDVGPAECWDAAPQRSGERAAIASMVQYAIDEHGADEKRVFAAGASSGACMTNALMAAYPEVFSAGSVLAGIPAGAWTTGNSCCGQNSNRSGEEWGNIVRTASPDFMGQRPRLQLWHGTSDTTLNYSNLAEEVKQWTNVLGVTEADAATEDNQPKPPWNRKAYTDEDGLVVLESHIGQGKPHDLTGENLWSDVVRFFGLDQDPDPNMGSGGADGVGSGGTGMGAASGAGGQGAGGSEITIGTGGSNTGTGAGGTPALGSGSAPGTDAMGSGGTVSSTTSGVEPTDDGSVGSGGGDEGSGCQISSGPVRPGSLGWLLVAALGWALRRRVGGQARPQTPSLPVQTISPLSLGPTQC